MQSHLSKLFFLIFFLFSIAETAKASHIMGGEVTYLYLDNNGPVGTPFRYKIKFNIYTNCDTIDYNNYSSYPHGLNFPFSFDVYNASDGSLYKTFPEAGTPSLIPTITNIVPSFPQGCSSGAPTGLCVKQNTAELIINLPVSFSGFYVKYSNFARNAYINNLLNPDSYGNTFYTFIPASIYKNSSPQFTDIPVPYICLNDTNTILNSAVDPDGDQLIYSFAQPYDQSTGSNFIPPPASIPYFNSTFNSTQPFGPAGYANINASNGLTNYKSTMLGNYVVVIEIKEYRTINGVQTLLTSTRRDFQILVGNCSSNNSKPAFTNTNVTYNIQAGDNVCFNIAATDVNNDSITLKATGNILNGSNGYTGPLATFNNNIKGRGSVSSQLCWNTSCSTLGSFNIYASAKDNGCPPKTNNTIYTINVTPFTGPAQIFGPDTLCTNSTSAMYRVSGFTNVTYNWTVSNGTITSPLNNDTIYVTWSSTVGVKSISATVTTAAPGNCTATKSKNVYIKQGSGTIAATPHNATICLGSSVQLSASGGTNYIWSPATGLSNATISNPVANPTVTTKYKVTQSGAGTCSNFDSVTVTVIPNVANAGIDKALCSQASIVIGSDSVAGYRYSWKPITGISDTTLSKPTLTLTNNTSSPVLYTYIQTSVNRASGCTFTDTVIITVNPVPIAIAGPDRTLCSGDTLFIGAAAVSGTTYSWSPATGLSSSTASKPVVNLTNITTSVSSTQYILTSTKTGCQKKDTVIVSVVPKVANAGIDKTFCGTAATLIGSDSITGYRYSWTPTTGLSDSLFSKPTDNIINNGNVPIIISFIQKATHRASGCVSRDTMKMTVNPLPLAIAGLDKTLCSGDTVSIGASSISGTNYLWSPATGLNSSSASRPVVSLTNNTTAVVSTQYILTSTIQATGCNKKDTVIVSVVPKAANAGIDKTFCGKAATVIGSDSITGYRYRWAPTIGLSDSLFSKPTATITNNSSSNPIVIFYVQTATHRASGCVSKDTMIMTVNPIPLAIAGPDRILCSGDTVSIGVANVSGPTHSWSPATGLSSSSASKPVVSLTNNTTVVVSTQYILTSFIAATSCSNKDTVIVSVVPKVAYAGIDKTFCGTAATLIGSDSITGYRYSWTPTTGLSDSLFSKPTDNIINNGNVPIIISFIQKATHRASGCVSRDTMKMTVNPLPLAIAGPDRVLCSGDTASIGNPAVSGTTYLWVPAAGLNSATVSKPIVRLINNTSLPINTQYVLTSTIPATGCQKKDTVIITVNPLPAVNAGTDKIFCSGDTVSVGGSSLANTRYSWSPVTGLSSDTISNPALTLKNNGAIANSILYIVTSTNKTTACINKDTLLVTVNPLPLVNAGADKVFCSGDSVQLGAAAIAGTSYLWIPAAGLNNGTRSNPKLGLTNNTNFADTISYIIKATINSTGCFKNDTVRVIVNPLPVALLSGTANICSSDTITIGLDSISNYSYRWNPVAGLSKPSSAKSLLQLSNTGSAPDTNYYVRTITNVLTSCVKKDSVKVIVRPRPGLFPITGSRSVCPGVQQVDYTINNIPGTSYQWFVKGGIITSAQNNDSVKIDWGTADDSAKVKMLPVNVYGCPGDTNIINVKIKIQLETATPDGIDTICLNSAHLIRYQTVNTTGSIYTWKTAGLSNTILSGNGSNSVNVDWQGTGIGKIWIDKEANQTPTNYCEGASDTLFVKINQSPDSTLKINGAISLCENIQGISYTFHGMPGSTYQWIINPSPGGTIVYGNNTDSIRINWGPADTITLSVQETSVDGCIGKLIDTVIILHPSPNTSLSGNNVNICPENISGQTYFAQGFSQSTFQWIVNGGNINGTNGNDSIHIDWMANAAVRNISVVETTNFGCVGQTASQPFIFDPSIIVITVISDEYADERYIEIKWQALFTSNNQLTISRREGNIPNSSWVTVANVSNTDSIYRDGILPTDTSDYQYKISGMNACGNEIVSFPLHKSVLLIKASQTETDLSISWTKYQGWPVKQYEIWKQLENGSFVLFAVVDSSTTNFLLQNAAIDGFHQCFRIKAVKDGASYSSWSNDLCFDFLNDIFIPNLITPNNDGANDVFKIKNIQLYPDNSLNIYNQWGESVYMKEGYNNEWAADVSDGVYYYYLKISRTGKEYRGWIHVLK
jgi:gliding motility-associated-like protein